MESDDFAGFSVKVLFAQVDNNSQDVSELAIRIKNFTTNEQQLVDGAQFLFDKAVSDPIIGTRCAELAKDLADIMIEESSLRPKTFRDCVVQLAMDKMKIPITRTEDSEYVPLVLFLIHLHKVEMLSTEFMNYRISFFAPLRNYTYVNEFLEALTLRSTVPNFKK